MKPGMQAERTKLQRMLDEHELTQGMYVRVHGAHLIVGREVSVGPNTETEKDDRIRFTQLGKTNFGLSVKRHTGRWEKTPFSGTLRQTADAARTFMQHIVASY